MLKLESLKDFKLSLNDLEKISGGRLNGEQTEVCTQQCSNQFDCAKDDGTGDYPTTKDFDYCDGDIY